MVAPPAMVSALTLPDGLESDYGQAWERYLRSSEARLELARAKRIGHSAERRPVRLFADYRPHQKQWATHKTARRFAVIVAGRRGGKTLLGAREFLLRLFRRRDIVLAAGHRWYCPGGKPKRHTAPLVHCWAVAPTYQLGLVQQRELQRALRRAPELVMSWADNRLWLSGGVLVEFRTAEKPNSLVGDGISVVWVDEAARCKRDAWFENIRPALSDNAGDAIFTSTPLGRNWLYDVWCEADKPDSEYSAHTWYSVDNTARPEVIEDARKARETMPRAVYRRNFEADWDAFDGQVFEDWDPRTHIVAPSQCPTDGERIVAGQDWGFSNPGCQLRVIRRDGRLYVTREHYERRLHVRLPEPQRCWVSLARTAQREGCETWWCDPASSENIDHFYSAGLDARQAVNSVVDGIECVSMMLHGDRTGPKLVISADCENLIRELPGYHYAVDSRGVSLERPVKADDHSVDALRYAVHSEESYKDLAPGMAYLRLVVP